MKFKLKIECEGSAFHNEDCPDTNGCCPDARNREVRRILNRLCDGLEDAHRTDFPKLYDQNGNNTGSAAFHAG